MTNIQPSSPALRPGAPTPLGTTVAALQPSEINAGAAPALAADRQGTAPLSPGLDRALTGLAQGSHAAIEEVVTPTEIASNTGTNTTNTSQSGWPASQQTAPRPNRGHG